MKYLIENIKNIESCNPSDYSIKKEKILKINMLKNSNDKKRSILGELLLIKGLNRLYKVQYNTINIAYNNYGKPYITGEKYKFIKYNISHSHDYSICVFNHNNIGVDIEKIHNINLKIIDKFATSKEKEYILANENTIYERLFTIYTLKEAYFKMLGKNLQDTKKIEFTIKNNKIFCSNKKVICHTINKIDEYIIAVCIEK